MNALEAKRLAAEIDAFDASRRFIASVFKIFQDRYIVEVWDRIDHEKHTIRSRGDWQRLREGVTA